MEINEIKERLKEAIKLEPLEQEEFIESLAKLSGKKKTRIREQLDTFIKEDRLKNENFKNCNDTPINNLSNKLGAMFDKKELARHILNVQPCWYDKARNWWLWNWPETKWERVDETDILNAIEKQATINTINSKEKNEMLEALKQESRKEPPVKIGTEWIQFKNILYNILTGEKKRAMPINFVTNPVPWELSEDNFMETPVMDRIFAEWVGEDNVKMLYEIMAYCMLPDYPLHRIFCFIGSGMNGKSKFLELLRLFIGEANCCSTELDTLLQSRFEVTRLHKKLVCQMGETNFNEMSKTSQLKKLSGGDLIGFEYKNKDTFEDNNYAKIIIATNNLPTTTDKTIGFYRRWMIIDFPNQFSEKKDILEDIPREEMNALALKCVYILKDLLDRREFTNEGSIEERTKKYEDHSNPLEKFMKEFTVEDYNGHIWKWEFEKRLNQWCKENRFREISDVGIGKRMKEIGIEQRLISAGEFVQGKQWRSWIGIKWANQDNQEKQVNPTQFHM